MLELPEVINLAEDLNHSVQNRIIKGVCGPTKVHKFCWYQGNPVEYDTVLRGHIITHAEGFGIFVDLCFDNGYRLSINDGVNLRLLPTEKAPKNYQLLIELDNGFSLVFTVSMYGGIVLHGDDYDNEYYVKSRKAVPILSSEFSDYFQKILSESKPTLSAKAFLATEQRFLGIGNGVLQDILFEARIHPKRKLETLSEKERQKLLDCVITVLKKMTTNGGRDTERNLFGETGKYMTKMSKFTSGMSCQICGGTITKEAYLGGSVYYCPVCQAKQRG